MTEDEIRGIGFPEEQSDFIRRNGKFFENFETLLEVSFCAGRSWVGRTGRQAVVSASLVRECWEDFAEILLLAGNGYGIGAMKLLRSLFERAATAAYLMQNADACEDFLKHEPAQQRKKLQAFIDASPDHPKARESLSKVLKDCETANSPRQPHWNKGGFLEIAKATIFGNHLAACYYTPLEFAHPTPAGLNIRIRPQAATKEFQWESQPKQADIAVRLGHMLLLMLYASVLDTLTSDELRKALDKATDGYKEIWGVTDES